MKKQNGKKGNKMFKSKCKTFSLYYLYLLDTFLTHKERLRSTKRQKLNMFSDALTIFNVALNFISQNSDAPTNKRKNISSSD